MFDKEFYVIFIHKNIWDMLDLDDFTQIVEVVRIIGSQNIVSPLNLT